MKWIGYYVGLQVGEVAGLNPTVGVQFSFCIALLIRIQSCQHNKAHTDTNEVQNVIHQSTVHST